MREQIHARKVSIAAKPTVYTPGHPASDDALASQRSELLEQLKSAEAALLAAIVDLRRGGDGALLAQNETDLAALAQMRTEIGRAGPTALAAMHGVVTTAVAKAQSSADQARTATATAQTIKAQELAAVAAESREQVSAMLRDMRHFDGGLRFALPNEEEEYRQREAERRAYIEAEHAKHTPQGDLNAAGGTLCQLIDTKAHSPGATPELDKRLGELMATTEKLRESAKANGVSTEEFDRRLRDDLRHIMKSKGISDAEINARFAATHDPMEAAKAYIRNENDLQQLRQTAREAAQWAQSEPSTPIIAAQPATTHHAIGSVIAKLQMTGITEAIPHGTAHFDHGVAANEKPAATERVRQT